MPDPPAYRRPVFDPLGLVAGRFDALGLGDVLAHATHQHPALRDLSVGEAVKAMVLKGLGCSNHALDLVRRFFQHQPTYRLVSPRLAPAPRTDDALGRALEPLQAHGVTELYSLMAATAAERLGRAPRFGPLERTRVHVEGRDHRDEAPGEPVVHRTRGQSRAQRPELNHVMLELMGEPQAGIPLLMTPRSGHRRAAHDGGEAVRVHLHQWQTTDGMPALVADRALDREAKRQQLAQTHLQWSTRLPATVSPAQAVLAQANPQILAWRTAGSRDDAWPSSDGGMAPRGVLIAAERRPAQARRSVDRPWRQPRDQATKAVKT